MGNYDWLSLSWERGFFWVIYRDRKTISYTDEYMRIARGEPPLTKMIFAWRKRIMNTRIFTWHCELIIRYLMNNIYFTLEEMKYSTTKQAFTRKFQLRKKRFKQFSHRKFHTRHIFALSARATSDDRARWVYLSLSLSTWRIVPRGDHYWQSIIRNKQPAATFAQAAKVFLQITLL